MGLSGALILACGTVAIGQAAVPAELLDRELDVFEAALLSFDEREVDYRTPEGEAVSRGIDELARVRFAAAGQEQLSEAGMIELADGQRLRGEWAGVADEGQTLIWQHEQIGAIEVRIDDLARVELQARWTEERDGGEPMVGEDRLVLANGDEQRGFIERLSEQGLVFQIQGQDEPIELTLRQLALFDLANPEQDAAETEAVVELMDGSRLLSEAVRLEDGMLRFRPGVGQQEAEEVEVAVGQTRQIEFRGDGQRLVSMDELSMEVVSGAEVFGVSLPPTWVDGGLRMNAPIALELALPEGASRFAANASLDLDEQVSPIREQWADFYVVVEAEQTQREQINTWQREARLNLAVEGPSLRLDLEPGRNGPILARLRLSDAVVLID